MKTIEELNKVSEKIRIARMERDFVLKYEGDIYLSDEFVKKHQRQYFNHVNKIADNLGFNIDWKRCGNLKTEKSGEVLDMLQNDVETIIKQIEEIQKFAVSDFGGFSYYSAKVTIK